MENDKPRKISNMLDKSHIQPNQEKNTLYKQGLLLLVFAVVLILVLILRGYNQLNSTEEGQYLVFACYSTDNCYTLRADVSREEGNTYVDKLYFNNGGYIYLDCVLEKDFCYEIDSTTALAKENGKNWDITIVERLKK